jgi:hypothetical protein
MAKLSTNRARYIELMKNPLMFLHKNVYSYVTSDGKTVEKRYWEPIDEDFKGEIKNDEFSGNSFNYELVVAEPIRENHDDGEVQENEMVAFDIHAVNENEIRDWCVVIHSYLIRSQMPDDKYPYIHLLWMLNYREWDNEIFSKAITMYDVKTQPYIINVLIRICRCLSLRKQSQIKEVLTRYNFNYIVYSSDVIKEAINHVTPVNKDALENENLFGLVDIIMGDDEHRNRMIDEQTENRFLCSYRWLHNDEAKMDYSSLVSVYALSSHWIQMDIVKRYFHDLRFGRTYFDDQLFGQFRENKYSEFIRYRYCLYSPEEPINLSVPLLCDCILTLYQTSGKSFQSFDGVLDFVMTHCDIAKPNIRLGMEEFLPQCNGGAVLNKSFDGFIDYNIVFELDESKFTEENLQGTIRKWLDTRPRHFYYSCGFDEEGLPLSDQQLQHCQCPRLVDVNTPKGVVQQEIKGFSCLSKHPYENKWVVSDTDYVWLNHFLKEPLPAVDYNDNTHKSYIVDFEQTSTEVLGNYIRSLVDLFEKDENGRFVIRSGKLKDFALLIQYSKPITMRIVPQSLPIVGREFDVFGIWQTLCEEKKMNPLNVSDETMKEFRKWEAAEIRNRVVDTLKAELKVKEFNGDFFEVPYNKDLLLKLRSLYYFKRTISDDPKDDEIQFLTKQSIKNYMPFCAPKLSEEHNRATGLPFFWCRGLECFHNCLGQQTLAKCTSWHKYTLYHMIEIIGFPMLKETEAGLEPDEPVKEFIACVNRVMKKFRRLKCRNCGHLMYTDKSSGYNRYNYYSCINPTCAEYNHPVYLSYCYKCKRGLIDSRDSAQCPNGWYICPDCHACCDDALYDRQAQRYYLTHRPLPWRVESKLGQGHNDKGMFFCHQCGTQLQYFGEEGMQKWGCPQCNVEYKNQKQLSTPFAGC